MTFDEHNPGNGWRLLRPGEKVRPGDMVRFGDGTWGPVNRIGPQREGKVYRREIPLSEVKQQPVARDPWERLRQMTLDELITSVKLSGSGGQIRGFTTPEGWPFRIVVAVGAPGNERAIEICDRHLAEMMAAAQWTNREDREEAK